MPPRSYQEPSSDLIVGGFSLENTPECSELPSVFSVRPVAISGMNVVSTLRCHDSHHHAGRSWRSNFIFAKRQGSKTYGTYPELSLAQARTAQGIFRSGGASKRSQTFEEVAKKWLKLKLPTLVNGKHKIQVSGRLERFAYPMIGAMPVDFSHGLCKASGQCKSMQLDSRPVGPVNHFRQRYQRGFLEAAQGQLVLLVQRPVHHAGHQAFDKKTAFAQGAHQTADR